MAQNTNKTLEKDSWVELTNALISTITFQNIGTSFMLVKATTDALAPTSLNGTLRYNPGQGERAVAVADLFPGVTSSSARLWAYVETAGKAFVSHG